MNLKPTFWIVVLGLLAACSLPSKPNPQPDPKPSFDLQPATDKLPILQGGEA